MAIKGLPNTAALATHFEWAWKHIGSSGAIDLEAPQLNLQFSAYCIAIFGECRELCTRKEKDYGSTWVQLGAKGLMVYLRAKAGRLWNLLWKGNAQAVKDEAIRDTLIDLINYCLFILYCLDTGNMLGED